MTMQLPDLQTKVPRRRSFDAENLATHDFKCQINSARIVHRSHSHQVTIAYEPSREYDRNTTQPTSVKIMRRESLLLAIHVPPRQNFEPINIIDKPRPNTTICPDTASTTIPLIELHCAGKLSHDAAPSISCLTSSSQLILIICTSKVKTDRSLPSLFNPLHSTAPTPSFSQVRIPAATAELSKMSPIGTRIRAAPSSASIVYDQRV